MFSNAHRRGWTKPLPDERTRVTTLLGQPADLLFADDVRIEVFRQTRQSDSIECCAPRKRWSLLCSFARSGPTQRERACATSSGELTDDELDRLAARRDELIGTIQKRYGYQREMAAAGPQLQTATTRARIQRDSQQRMRRRPWLTRELCMTHSSTNSVMRMTPKSN